MKIIGNKLFGQAIAAFMIMAAYIDCYECPPQYDPKCLQCNAEGNCLICANFYYVNASSETA